MIGTVLGTKTAGWLLSLTDKLAGGEGEDGIVYEATRRMHVRFHDSRDIDTFDIPTEWLVKVWKPAGRSPDSPEWHDAEKRYQTFSALNLPGRELRCLPQEYATVQGVPAYLMRRAKGRSLQAAWKDVEKLDLTTRLRIAKSLAVGIGLLHSNCVVLSDFKRDNFFLDFDTLTVQVIDVDGGGYDGDRPGTSHFPPNRVANERYVAPELSGAAYRNMALIWRNPKRRREADRWSLAALIYDLLVLDVPFSKRYFQRTDFLSDQVPWPAPEQADELEALDLPDIVWELFLDVFDEDRRRDTTVFRPAASHWITALSVVLNRRRPVFQPAPLSFVS